MSEAGNYCVLNLERLQDSAGGDPELVRELIDLYVESTDSQLPALEEAVSSGDGEASRSVAHGIKGASAAMGAEEAAEAFRQLEVLGRGGDAVELPEALRIARQAYGRAREQLRGVAA